MKKWQKEATWALALIVGAVLLFVALGGDAHAHDINIDNSTNYYGSSGGSSGVNGGVFSPGASIAAASGVCVRDWDKQMQKCISWAVIDSEDYEDGVVHGVGGGVTFRVDQFSMSVYGGVENIDADDTTMMFTGSINWR